MLSLPPSARPVSQSRPAGLHPALPPAPPAPPPAADGARQGAPGAPALQRSDGGEPERRVPLGAGRGAPREGGSAAGPLAVGGCRGGV